MKIMRIIVAMSVMVMAFGAPAWAADEKPITGTVMGVHWIDDTVPGCSWEFYSMGTGTMAHLGKVHYYLEQCTIAGPAGITSNGTITFTAANDDVLVLAHTMSSQVVGAFEGFTVEGTWSVAGGTGRFEHADGNGSLSGFGDIPGGDMLFGLDGEAVFDFVGDVAYDASDRSES